LLPLCFFIAFLFFLAIDIDIPPRTTRPLYNDLEGRGPGNFLLLTISSIFCLSMANIDLFASLPLFFLGNRIRAANDTDSLLPERNGTVVRLKIRPKGLGKFWGNLTVFF
jgi:hypothetical protein